MDQHSDVAGRRVMVSDVRDHVTCGLCSGYLIDATTVVQCLHSYCRSCIVRHLATGDENCPQCRDVDGDCPPRKPRLRRNKLLQRLVYKLVPGLLQRELQRRRDFASSTSLQSQSGAGSRDSAVTSELFRRSARRLLTGTELLSIGLEPYGAPEAQHDSLAEGDQTNEEEDALAWMKPRYLLCRAALSVHLLKKFIRMKFDLTPETSVALVMNDEVLLDDYTLTDLVYIFQLSSKDKPLMLQFMVGPAAEQAASSRVPLPTAVVDRFTVAEPPTVVHKKRGRKPKRRRGFAAAKRPTNSIQNLSASAPDTSLPRAETTLSSNQSSLDNCNSLQQDVEQRPAPKKRGRKPKQRPAPEAVAVANVTEGSPVEKSSRRSDGPTSEGVTPDYSASTSGGNGNAGVADSGPSQEAPSDHHSGGGMVVDGRSQQEVMPRRRGRKRKDATTSDKGDERQAKLHVDEDRSQSVWKVTSAASQEYSGNVVPRIKVTNVRLQAAGSNKTTTGKTRETDDRDLASEIEITATSSSQTLGINSGSSLMVKSWRPVTHRKDVISNKTPTVPVLERAQEWLHAIPRPLRDDWMGPVFPAREVVGVASPDGLKDSSPARKPTGLVSPAKRHGDVDDASHHYAVNHAAGGGVVMLPGGAVKSGSARGPQQQNAPVAVDASSELMYVLGLAGVDGRGPPRLAVPRSRQHGLPVYPVTAGRPVIMDSAAEPSRSSSTLERQLTSPSVHPFANDPRTGQYMAKRVSVRKNGTVMLDNGGDSVVLVSTIPSSFIVADDLIQQPPSTAPAVRSTVPWCSGPAQRTAVLNDDTAVPSPDRRSSDDCSEITSTVADEPTTAAPVGSPSAPATSPLPEYGKHTAEVCENMTGSKTSSTGQTLAVMSAAVTTSAELTKMTTTSACVTTSTTTTTSQQNARQKKSLEMVVNLLKRPSSSTPSSASSSSSSSIAAVYSVTPSLPLVGAQMTSSSAAPSTAGHVIHNGVTTSSTTGYDSVSVSLLQRLIAPPRHPSHSVPTTSTHFRLRSASQLPAAAGAPIKQLKHMCKNVRSFVPSAAARRMPQWRHPALDLLFGPNNPPPVPVTRHRHTMPFPPRIGGHRGACVRSQHHFPSRPRFRAPGTSQLPTSGAGMSCDRGKQCGDSAELSALMRVLLEASGNSHNTSTPSSSASFPSSADLWKAAINNN